MNELAEARGEAFKYRDLYTQQLAVNKTLREENVDLSKNLSDANRRIKLLKKNVKDEKETSEAVLYELRSSQIEETGELFDEVEKLRTSVKRKQTQLKVGFSVRIFRGVVFHSNMYFWL